MKFGIKKSPHSTLGTLSAFTGRVNEPIDKAVNDVDIDIIIVTYNSSGIINDCLASIANVDYPLTKIHVYVVDNGSEDDSISTVESFKAEFELKSISAGKNIGFGRGNNLGAKQGSSPYLLFLNPDARLTRHSLKALAIDIGRSSERTGAWECRQFPYEHPKQYNPASMEIEWASGACLLVRRNVFHRISGFDPLIFLYAEDVDISWRVRKKGYSIRYVPSALVEHNAKSEEIKLHEHYYSMEYNLYLRMKFGCVADVFQYFSLLSRILKKPPVEGLGQQMYSAMLRVFLKTPLIFLGRFLESSARSEFKPRFIEWAYALHRRGAWVETKPLDVVPGKIRCFVKAGDDLDLLYETLGSLKNQTIAIDEVCLCGRFFGKTDLPENQENYKFIETENVLEGIDLSDDEHLFVLEAGAVLYADCLEHLLYEYKNGSIGVIGGGLDVGIKKLPDGFYEEVSHRFIDVMDDVQLNEAQQKRELPTLVNVKEFCLRNLSLKTVVKDQIKDFNRLEKTLFINHFVEKV